MRRLVLFKFSLDFIFYNLLSNLLTKIFKNLALNLPGPYLLQSQTLQCQGSDLLGSSALDHPDDPVGVGFG